LFINKHERLREKYFLPAYSDFWIKQWQEALRSVDYAAIHLVSISLNKERYVNIFKKKQTAYAYYVTQLLFSLLS
jgi:hypothetical protein